MLLVFYTVLAGPQTSFCTSLWVACPYSLDLACDSEPSRTFDSNPTPTLVIDSSPVSNFGPGYPFDSYPGPILDSALIPAFNSNFAITRSSNLNEAGD
ncbi:hypothetical protein EVAR_93648_1 [Eumeta japonica]|uniref:Uncharacterized protein n=1 Tax=Eumeta variegata TaxID=151549 RepID=A0A4C1TQM7_EUMVA|nr:hypothetical protein EVAR_93648_1 [Eumeta japonica]